MWTLAISTVRYRPGSFTACFVALVFGATMTMAFGALFDTALTGDVDAVSRESLLTMGSILGGWTVILVGFAVASTLTLLVHQRQREMATLKLTGATPRQIGRLLAGETAIIALIAVVAALPIAIVAGRTVFSILKDSGQVGPSVEYTFGPIAIAMGFVVAVIVAVVSAVWTARATTRKRSSDAARTVAAESAPMGRKRIITGLTLVALGITAALMTATVMRDIGHEAMAAAGQSIILTSIGLAVLGPAIVRWAVKMSAGFIEKRGGPSGYMTALTLQQSTRRLASALTPIVLFTGIATGTLYLQSTENAYLNDIGVTKSVESLNIETGNLVVVGMLSMFVAILLVNTLVTSVRHRRREFGQQRLAGATPRQVMRTVTVESVFLSVTGIVAGTVVAVMGAVAYSISRTGTAVPEGSLGIYLGVVAIAVMLTVVTSSATARSNMATPAVHTLAALFRAI